MDKALEIKPGEMTVGYCRTVDENTCDKCGKIKSMRIASISASKVPHKCPMCDGKGKGELRSINDVSITDNCRSCDGKGIVWG